MADSLDLQREARRKKILENSDRRMKKLLGYEEEKENNEPKHSNEQTSKYFNEHAEENHRTEEATKLPSLPADRFADKNSVIVNHSSRESSPSVRQLSEKFSSQDSPTNSMLGQTVTRRRALKTESPERKTTTTSHAQPESISGTSRVSSGLSLSLLQFDLVRFICCVILAFVTRKILNTGWSIFFAESIMVPFTILQLGIYSLLPRFCKVFLPRRGSIIASALMLCGLEQNMLNTYNQITGYITAITEDLAVYLFSFIVVDLFVSD